jgi:hypothetical protein
MIAAAIRAARPGSRSMGVRLHRDVGSTRAHRRGVPRAARHRGNRLLGPSVVVSAIDLRAIVQDGLGLQQRLHLPLCRRALWQWDGRPLCSQRSNVPSHFGGSHLQLQRRVRSGRLWARRHWMGVASRVGGHVVPSPISPPCGPNAPPCPPAGMFNCGPAEPMQTVCKVGIECCVQLVTCTGSGPVQAYCAPAWSPQCNHCSASGCACSGNASGREVITCCGVDAGASEGGTDARADSATVAPTVARRTAVPTRNAAARSVAPRGTAVASMRGP